MSNSLSENIDKMTKSHLRNVQQLAVFYTGDKGIYCINISKVKAFIIRDEISIDPTPSDNNIVLGIATIRGLPITLISIDRWLGKEQFTLIKTKTTKSLDK